MGNKQNDEMKRGVLSVNKIGQNHLGESRPQSLLRDYQHHEYTCYTDRLWGEREYQVLGRNG